MLIFGLPPSDPAPEFEPGLNLGLNPPPYLAQNLGVKSMCMYVYVLSIAMSTYCVYAFVCTSFHVFTYVHACTYLHVHVAVNISVTHVQMHNNTHAQVRAYTLLAVKSKGQKSLHHCSRLGNSLGSHGNSNTRSEKK